MKKGHNITLLGTGLIGRFYTMTLHGQRGRDRVHNVCAVPEESAKNFAKEFDIPKWTTSMEEAVADPETDTVIIGIPNDLHEKAVHLAAKAGKAILCTKPLGRNAKEAKSMLDAVEKAGVFAGYLEDLCYTPKTLKSIRAIKNGALGQVLWARSRETHPGPHSAWFWDISKAGGGAIVDLGCHCIEIIRNFIGKDIRPVEVLCTSDTLVHPIEAEDSGLGLIRFANRAIGQFEVSWTFRGGMDLRDEVAGTEGTIWLNHFLRTGFEMFTAAKQGGYVAEKAETETGWLFPVGDEVVELGYVDMFTDMFESMEKGKQPMEGFYDGYVVNAIIDACYKSAKSKQWEKVELFEWRGKKEVEEISGLKMYDDAHFLIKKEKMPEGGTKVILKNKKTGEITQKIE
jgi:predicted dehydrogenase